MQAPTIDARPSTKVEVASPANAAEWERANVLLHDFFGWFEQVSGYTFSSVQDEAGEELRSPQTFYAPPQGSFFIARVDGRILGTTAVRVLASGVAEVKRVYVDPEARGLGVASRLLEAAISEARLLGAERVVLESHAEHMASALRLYRRRGFVQIPDYTDLAGKVEGVIAMELRL